MIKTRKAHALLALTCCALLAPAAAADATTTVSTELKGPDVVRQGKTAVYVATLRNTGREQIRTNTYTVRMGADPASGARLSALRFTGGAGAWSCSGTVCQLNGGNVDPGAASTFQISARVRSDVDLFVVASGNGIFVQPSAGPLIQNLSVPATIKRGSTTVVSFRLPQAASVTAVAERFGRLYRTTRTRVLANGRVRSTSKVGCLFTTPRRPRNLKPGESIRFKRGKPCRKRTGRLFAVTLGQGAVSAPVTSLGKLAVGGTYRLLLTPQSPVGVLGPVVRSARFTIVR